MLGHLDDFNLILLPVGLVLCHDDQVGVRKLEDVLDRVVQHPLHADPPQGHDRLHGLAQEGFEIPKLDDAGARTRHDHRVVEEERGDEGLGCVPRNEAAALGKAPESNGLTLAGSAKVLVDGDGVDTPDVADQRGLLRALFRVKSHQDSGEERCGEQEVARLPKEVASVRRDDEALQPRPVIHVPDLDKLVERQQDCDLLHVFRVEPDL